MNTDRIYMNMYIYNDMDIILFTNTYIYIYLEKGNNSMVFARAFVDEKVFRWSYHDERIKKMFIFKYIPCLHLIF